LNTGMEKSSSLAVTCFSQSGQVNADIIP
jgi:hypothetical protein